MAVRSGKILVLMGGCSSEREISLVSGASVLQALEDAGFDAEGMDMDERDEKGLEESLRRSGAAAVFIAAHGSYGEDGRLQSLLERMDIPYTGSGALASAVCFNKHFSKQALGFFGAPVPPFCFLPGCLAAADDAPGYGRLKFPVVVKPASGGSAIGITIAGKKDEIADCVSRAREEDREVLLEEYIEGRELTVSMLGNRNARVLPVIEIETEEEFYNYRAKYVPGRSRHTVPAKLSPGEESAVENVVRMVYRVLGCRGFARIDLILSGNGVPYVLDINTVPGFTATSLFPESARAAGMEMPILCSRIVGLALEGR